ncbi:DUF4097 family beta strand repeat-containing protein [Anaerotignum sp.]|uniref:DUF4097 family beta strand repeat-containing protein n=1 Tax=Anaerotignum sp. TaxID=2039241 RepID=UPI002A91FBEE|nr:DUF4097 family beta strand repeat-containing protein [Anaerotignum sp.]MCI7656808.1 DUF4097 domain-containing protein [Clostridia bacterium]MDY5416126.1 DUF4097 family beta strand repeat-containing protein [Anaerotignum sp.]
MKKRKMKKEKQWLILPVVLLFLCACGAQKQTVEAASEVRELTQSCKEIVVTADIGSVFIQKGETAALKTENIVPQWLTVTEENGVVTVSYAPPDEKAVKGMETDSHHLTLTVPEECIPEKAELTVGTGPLYVDGAEAKELFLHQGTGQMQLKNVTAGSLELECGGGLAKGENLQVAQKLTIHGGMGDVDFAGSLGEKILLDGGTGKISLTMPETEADYDISGSFFTRNVMVNGKTLQPEMSVEQNGGDLDSWEMDFDGDFSIPAQQTEGLSGKKQILIDGGTGEIVLTFTGDEEKAGAA